MEYSRLAVLNLYKSLLRYGNSINLTDKKYYLRVIRQQFKEHRDIVNPEERLRLIQVIHSFVSVLFLFTTLALINRCAL